jgi:hypothetical protein
MRPLTLLAACALTAGLAIGGRGAEPVTVTVRFIDARNGRPYTKSMGPCEITFLRRARQSRDTAAESRAIDLGAIRALPDSNGVMKLTLPTPMPGVIAIPTFMLGCTPILFDAKEVVEKGVVGKNLCRTKFAKKNVKFEAKPGEIIYFVAPPSFWERLDHALFF